MTIEDRVRGMHPMRPENHPVIDESTVQAALARYQDAKAVTAGRERELETAYHTACQALLPAAAERLRTFGITEHPLHRSHEEKAPIYEYDPSAYWQEWAYFLRPDGDVLHICTYRGLNESERRQVMPFPAFLEQHAQRSAASAEHIYRQLKHIIAAQSPSEVKTP